MLNWKLNNGYTLTEVTVVLIVIGVLASFGLPKYMASVEKSRSGEGVQILTALLNAQKALQQSTGSYTSSLNALEITIPQPRYFNAPPTVSTNVSSLASIVSINNGGYTLTIDQNGAVTCADGTTTGICQKLGY